MKVRLRSVVEIISGVQIAVPIKLKCVAVESIGSGFGDDIYDVAAAESVLSGERVGLHLEFLHVVHGRNVNHATPIQARVPCAVQQILRGVEESAAKIEERNVLVRATGNA